MSSESPSVIRREGGAYLLDQEINGLRVRARYSEESVNAVFLPLLRELTRLQQQRARRILVLLAAPPAAGKSTLVSFLQSLSEQTADVQPVQSIGMDGFHYPQSYLKSHTVLRDGEEVPLVSVKGSPPSFDLSSLRLRIRRLKEEPECPWPHYDRTLHDPVEGKIRVTRSIVLLEGNYLLLPLEGWRELKDEADYTIRILAESEDVRERLIARKMNSGLPRAEAEAFVDRSDLANVRLCARMQPADLTLRLTADGSYVRASDADP